LVIVNGAYGERMVKMTWTYQIPVVILASPENLIPDFEELDHTLATDPAITHVAAVHCETTTGILNPVERIGAIVRKYDRCYIVDAMSSFGAYPMSIEAIGIDYLISSSNKCIEGVPGFSFVLAKKVTLMNARGNARTLAMDLFSQWEGLEKDGQFRFTPPVHAILAFYQALLELIDEGGVSARAERYKLNYETTVAGMEAMGFKPYLAPEKRGYTITSFYYPDHPNFSFKTFYEKLAEKGSVIYPGKLSHADCFRVGHIGRLEKSDVFGLLSAVKQTLLEMGVE
jgi:2-aminoethylphosphonate-pyruvate transaminase